MNPQLQDRQLDALYAELPELECKRECAHVCQTTLIMSVRERARIRRAIGEPVKPRFPSGWCSVFAEGGCRAQEIKPMFCRLWGMTTDMPCPHGCVPSRWLTPEEAGEFMKRADEIGGRGDHRAELPAHQIMLPAYGTVARSSH